MLHEKNPPTAVFTETDRLAIDLIGACADAGLRVPQDVSIVGYDSTGICELIRPRLTSAAQPHREIRLEPFRETLIERHGLDLGETDDAIVSDHLR
ncbi:substrate-binding domain-containing protein [Microbacterium amylolyticum]|uniref:DNA-binding LacI/PurR family transcriptional regulator n=1 Tax=Microbacterium amylolyticum TaxID=936337 RepID=A0ABS4ZIW5_9MICO|nr:substrate-binding domain-containing protein [Microbacterium amylolyticum]MBP2437230.1 DNA-binding LacI/PurR family transcriptional regulator [Microbacterium amylolyticum]